MIASPMETGKFFYLQLRIMSKKIVKKQEIKTLTKYFVVKYKKKIKYISSVKIIDKKI